MLVAATLSLGCGSKETARRPFLLVTIDTLRADRVGCYGHEDAQTPAMDGLAARGVRFAQAVSHVPLTYPAHAIMLTGLLPPATGARDNNPTRPLSPNAVTLAERAREAGYRTGAVTAALPVESRFGLDQGFDLYDDTVQRRDALDVTDRALAFLAEEDGRPWFLWVHYYDPHKAYAAAHRNSGRDPYDASITFADAQLARLLDASSGADPVVLVTADHGESLGEHGEDSHGFLLYEAAIRIPMILAGLGRAGHVVDSQVALADIYPTALAAMGLGRRPGEGTHGRSLVPAARGETLADRPVYLEAMAGHLRFGWAPHWGLRTPTAKYLAGGHSELFDLTADPGESEDLLADNPGHEGSWADRLAAYQGIEELWSGDNLQAGPVDVDMALELAALGYTGAADGGGMVQPASGLPDPREMVDGRDRRVAIRQALADGDLDSAQQALGEFLSVVPEPDQMRRAFLRFVVTRHADVAVPFLEHHFEAMGRSPALEVIYAQALLGAGRPQDALDHLRDLPPDGPDRGAHKALARRARAALQGR